MTITNFKWVVKQLRVAPEMENQKNVVVEMDVVVVPTQEENNLVFPHFPQTISLKFDSGKPFIPFNELTESQAIKWAMDSYGEALSEIILQWESQVEIIKLKKSEAPVAIKMPWESINTPAFASDN